ncbi:MAG: hypothetical protein ISS46_01460 [Candidatus Omnitrophica bacterium]|nr:hypothetical protein [Candidatus Omnitrophota bacterium]
MKSKKRKIKGKKKEKRTFLVGIFLFIIGFMYLCQHMGVIKLGYLLGREKIIYKELSNLNRALYFEKASLKSPRYLNNIACSNLGLNVGSGVQLRRISVVSSARNSKNENRISKSLARIFGFNSKAVAKPMKKN